ncbi:MAG: malate dehydrogenase [Gammaproteobacteria bacterium]
MKISIIGLGRVGSTLAYTVMIKELCDELILVNRRPEVAIGDAKDLQHALPFIERQMIIDAGAIPETADSDIVVMCASGHTPKNMRSRLELGPANAELFEQLIPPLAKASPQAKLIIVTNPVDALTYTAIKLSAYPPSRVLGTGTLIDSARFRSMLSAEVGIHPDDLRAYILGEHGPSQFPALSLAQAGGEAIEDNRGRRRMFDQAVDAGFEVFRCKGYTNYAIAMAAALIIESIVFDKRHTMPISTLIDGYLGVRDVCLSVPVVVGREGITRVLQPGLNEPEIEAFRASAATVREAISELLRGQ